MKTVVAFLNKLASQGVRLSVEAGQINCYAQKGVLTTDIKEEIVRYKSQIIALFEDRQKQPQTQTDPSALTKSNEFPLSAGERGLYILQKLNPGTSAYNVPLCLRVNNEINSEILAKAWDCALEQFPILTTRVVEKEGNLYHLLDESCKTTIQERTIDCRDDQQLVSLLRARAKEPFDLDRGPLTRIELLRRQKQKPVLLLVVHHMVFDGTSAMILLRSLVTFYRQLCEGKPVRLSHDLLGYQGFVAWEEAMLASAEGAAHASYWQRQLDGELPVLELFPDSGRVASSGVEGKTVFEDLPEDLSRWVYDFSKAHSLPPSVIFLAVFQLLLYRHSNQEDIIVGMPVMGRAGQRFANEVGYFINMVPLRVRCGGRIRLMDFLRKVQATMLDGLYHSSYPFPLMPDRLKFRQWKRNPIFQVSYAYQNFVRPADIAAVLGQQILELESVAGIVQEGDADLGLEIFEKDVSSFSLHLKYRPALYAEATIVSILKRYGVLLRAVSENPNLFLHEYPILTKEERQKLLSDFNATRVEYTESKCVHELFAERAAMNSETTAVVCGNEQLSYQELYARSEELAVFLRAQGIKPDSLVGLCVERSLDMVVGLLGIMQAGGAYVPLDPDYPRERLQYMLEDAAPAMVLTQERLKERLPKSAVRMVALDSEAAVIERQARMNLDRGARGATSDHLAYVLYTSGSTGTPKGVMVRHSSVVNLWKALEKAIYASHAEWTRVSVNASFSFDSSVKQLAQLLSGRTLIIIPQDVRLDASAVLRFTKEHRIDVFDCTPSQLEALLGAGMFERTGGVPKAFLVGGEAVDSRLWRALSEHPEVAFYNVYGPAECTVDATVAQVKAVESLAHIGRPIANVQIYILDSHQQPVPMGVVGEIYIGGAGVARGYLNRPGLTAERFIADPFGGDRQGRLYKSGDLGRWRADGNIEYVGRSDQQVKLRGHRIELGEIEAQLSKHAGVKEAVVIAREDEPGEKRLVAYVTTTGQALGPEELRSHLLASVPLYMVPAAFVELEALPLTPNRKVDRKALPKPEAGAYASKEYERPQGKIEEALAAIWQELLHVERVGRNDNFFELGGHSLLAVQVMVKTSKHFKRMLPLAVLFTSPNVAALAKVISREEAPSFDILVPIQTGGNGLPVFAVPGAGGNVLSLRPLSKALGEAQPLFGLQAVGIDGKTAPLESVEQTAQANIAALRTLQPQGPYTFVGYSYGGVVAYEMARILLEQGEQVSSLILLDSIAPAVMQEKVSNDAASDLFEACTTMANLYGESVRFDLQRLRRSSKEENIQYVVGQLNDHGFEITGEQFAIFYSVFRANLHCHRTYKPSRLSQKIDVSLYRATQGRRDDPSVPRDYGWNELLQSPVCISDVDANHFSILEKVDIQGQRGRLAIQLN